MAFTQIYWIPRVYWIPRAISAFDPQLFNKTHVPISAIGRFFMLDAVPDIYDRILYIDVETFDRLFQTAIIRGPWRESFRPISAIKAAPSAPRLPA